MNVEPPVEDRLPYPTKPLTLPNGDIVEEFIIPEEDKEIVLERLYPFSPIPKLDDVVYDLHADKTFVVKDFRVTWEHGMNSLVSPYYLESGGTVIDWIDENSWVDDDYDDEDLDDEDFGDDDSETTDSTEDDDIPF